MIAKALISYETNVSLYLILLSTSLVFSPGVGGLLEWCNFNSSSLLVYLLLMNLFTRIS